MSFHTAITKSPLSVTATLINRVESVAADGSVTQTPTTVQGGVVGHLALLSATQRILGGIAYQDATHQFMTDGFTAEPGNGYQLVVGTTYYAILATTTTAVTGQGSMFQCLLRRIKE